MRIVLAFVLMIVSASTAAAGRPAARCGTVVEDDAVLDIDLHCDGAGIVLRNPRSVLQLNGHTVESTRSCADGAAPSGIVVERTADGAQILGPGLVRGFVTGIAMADAARVQVRDVRVSDSCGLGMLLVGTDGVRVRGAMLHRNGTATDEGGAIRVEQSTRFELEGAQVFANGAGAKGAAVDLRDCDDCRIVANRIVGNAGPGLRLDPESRGTVLERNVLLDQRGPDVLDQSNDGTYVLNLFERGDGLRPPARWPAVGTAASAQPAPAGCAVMHTLVAARTTASLACPDVGGGVRAVRNGIVAYRLLNPFTMQPFSGACDPGEVQPASGTAGGAVRCTNPDRTFAALLEITCCLM